MRQGLSAPLGAKFGAFAFSCLTAAGNMVYNKFRITVKKKGSF